MLLTFCYIETVWYDTIVDNFYLEDITLMGYPILKPSIEYRYNMAKHRGWIYMGVL